MKVSYALATLVAILAVASSAVAQNITDADILNFALNLEYLEANFYSIAVTGAGIDAKYRGGGPAAVGGFKAELFGDTALLAEELYQDELAHVIFLRTALADAAVPQPAIDLGASFKMAANAALGTTLMPYFSPYKSNVLFLHGAFIFEDVGVTAYKGAAPLIANKDYLSAAAGILAVEAYHAGAIRLALFARRDYVVKPYGAKVSAIVGAISALRAKLGGGSDLNIVTSDGAAVIAPTDSNKIAFGRTPSEVLSIVTAGAANHMGLFFPEGLNGNIK